MGSRPWHHGFLGSFSLAVTTGAVVSRDSRLILLTILATTPLSLNSMTLLGHAPPFTAIARGIVAPHREAYKRTIAVALYINVRLVFAMGWWPSSLGAGYGVAVALWAAWLCPRTSFDNGNTFIFVAPIFGGVAWDAGHQLACLGSGSCAWNAEVATVGTLLGAQVATLVVAFSFTPGPREGESLALQRECLSDQHESDDPHPALARPQEER